MLDGVKECLVIERGVSRIRQADLTLHMVPVQQFMVETMAKGWMGSSFNNRSYQKSQGSHLYMEKAKSSIPTVSVQSQLIGFFKEVLVQPGFNLAVDGSDVLASEVD